MGKKINLKNVASCLFLIVANKLSRREKVVLPQMFPSLFKNVATKDYSTRLSEINEIEMNFFLIL